MYYYGETRDGRYRVYGEKRNFYEAYDTDTDIFIRDTVTMRDQFVAESDIYENISVSENLLALTQQRRFFEIPSAQELNLALQYRDDVTKDPNQKSLAVLYDPERNLYIHLFAFYKAGEYISETMKYPAEDRKLRVEFYDGDGLFLDRVIVNAYPLHITKTGYITMRQPAVYCGQLIIPNAGDSLSGKSYLAAYDLDTGVESRYDGTDFDARGNVLITKKTVYVAGISQPAAFSVTKYVDGNPVDTLWFPKNALNVPLSEDSPVRYDSTRNAVQFLEEFYGPDPEPRVVFSYPFSK